MSGRTQSAEALTQMLKDAYAERAWINQRISGLEEALREVSPEYAALMQQIEN